MGRVPRPSVVCGHCGKVRRCSRLILGEPACDTCRLRFRRSPGPCPGCGIVKVLAFHDARRRPSCAACTGNEPIYACVECGREDSPFGRKCAPCTLSERLSALLADPGGGIHPRLRPVFDALMAARRPQSVLFWLTRASARPDILRAMASGELDISHATFDVLPPDRAVVYLRDLLSAVAVLPPYQPSVERVAPWLRDVLAALPRQHADVLDRFARWQLLRRLRLLGETGTVTRGGVNNARATIVATARFLTWLDSCGITLAALAQGDVDTHLTRHPGRARLLAAFLQWTARVGVTAHLEVPVARSSLPEVTVSDEQRWRHVGLLLRDDTIRLYARVAGLFILLFAQPLSRVCRMRPDHIQERADGTVTVSFDTVPVELPGGLDRLVLEQHARSAHDCYAAHRQRWLFPGRHAGRHLATENVRSQLVARGIHPGDARKAAMFALAAEIPTPVLADLIGVSPNTATRWASLAARDWAHYAAMRR